MAPPPYTLFHLVYRTMREAQLLIESTATGGSTSSLVDSTRTENNDFWNNGSALLIYDAGGAAAAPEGEWSVITDWALSGTAFSTTWTVAPASGDRYAASRKAPGNQAWLQLVVGMINSTLIDLGPIPVVDTTTLVIAADQTEYELPLAAKRSLRQVFLQFDNTDANDNQWREIFNWEIQWKAANSKSLLILPKQYTSGYYLKLVYLDTHPVLNLRTEYLNEYVPVERVIYTAAKKCLEYARAQTRWRDWDQRIAELTKLSEEARVKYPIRKPTIPARFINPADIGIPAERPDEPNIVRIG